MTTDGDALSLFISRSANPAYSEKPSSMFDNNNNNNAYSILSSSPILDIYKTFRLSNKNLSKLNDYNVIVRQRAAQQGMHSGVVPLYFEGACSNWNFNTPESDHIPACKNTSPSHILNSHFNPFRGNLAIPIVKDPRFRSNWQRKPFNPNYEARDYCNESKLRVLKQFWPVQQSSSSSSSLSSSKLPSSSYSDYYRNDRDRNNNRRQKERNDVKFAKDKLKMLDKKKKKEKKKPAKKSGKKSRKNKKAKQHVCGRFCSDYISIFSLVCA